MTRIAILLISISLILIAPGAALAKKKKKRVVYSSQYAIPFTCGNNPADLSSALPGDYAIGIDVLNSGTADIAVDEQVHLTFPPGAQMPSFSSDIVTQTIAAGSAIQLSCDDLLGAGFVFQNPPPASSYVQGLLVLTSRSALQVFATRTSQGTAGDLSLQTERVQRVSVRASATTSKVVICHAPPGNPANAHTISVGAASWPAHQLHGDLQGACTP